MKKIISYCLTALFFLVITLRLPFSDVQAQQTQQTKPSNLYDLSVSPPTAYLRIRPGNLAVHTIALKNNGSAAISVTPKLVDFVSDGATGQPVLANNSSFPYLDLDKTSFENVILKPGATAQLTLHFTIPSTAENQEYPLTVLFEARLENESVNETSVTGTIGSNLVVLVSDTDALEERFSVDTFNTSKVIDSFQPIKFAPILKNNSFAAGVASGSAQITNFQGTVVAQYQISPEVVLGYTSREIQPLSIDNDPNTIELNAKGLRIFSYKSPFLIGPYTISVFTPSGDSSNPQLIEQKIIVWAIPISLLAAVIIALIFISIYSIFRARKYAQS